jgi:hypothetical protein
VKDDQYLNLAVDYNTPSMMQFPALRKVGEEGSFRIEPQNMWIGKEDIQGGIIKHPFSTIAGDSGIPLLVQPPELGGRCLIVAIHAAYIRGTSVKKGVRVTNAAISKLSEMEKSMTGCISLIRIQSLHYESTERGSLRLKQLRLSFEEKLQTLAYNVFVLMPPILPHRLSTPFDYFALSEFGSAHPDSNSDPKDFY